MASAEPTRTAHAGMRPEWWEVLAARGQTWATAHPALLRRLRRLVVVSVWACLPLVVVMYVAVPTVRQGVNVWLAIYWLLIAWFLLARTKTVSWRLVSTVFAVGTAWALAIALLSRRLVDITGLPITSDGPRIAVAALTEESLKLLPLALLAVLAPGRVRRFAVADFLLIGLASGLAFQAFEDFFRRTYVAITKPGLLDLILDPSRTGPGSGAPQYGLSPISGGSSTDYAAFGGHHVLTALTAVTVGLGVAAWRHGRRQRPLRRLTWSAVAVLAPVLMWWVTVADHAGNNATGGLLGRTWVETQRPSTPWLMRSTWDQTGEGAHRAGLLLLLLFVALLVDARRLRRGDGSPPPPAGFAGWGSILWAPGAIADRWGATVAGWTTIAAADVPRPVAAAVRTIGAALRATCALAAYSLRDLSVMLVARSREPGEGSTAAALRGFAAASMLRKTRLDAMSAAAPTETRQSRRLSRAVGIAGLIVLIAVGTWVAVRLTTHIGVSVTRAPTLDWLAGLLDSLADWWASLGPVQQMLLIAGIAALIVLSGGTFGLALGVAGTAGFLATHGHGAADFVRDPRRATTDFLTNLTPQQLAGYAVEIALARLLPAGVGGVAGRGVRRTVDNYRLSRGGTRTRAGVPLSETELGLELADVLKNATFLKLVKSAQYMKTGSFRQASLDFDRLTHGVTVVTRNSGLRTATLSNGTKINVRPFSSGQLPTLEIDTPGNIVIKIRY